MSGFQTLAFIGTVLVAIAYIPQIIHLIRSHCAYGISVKAWAMWLIATLLIFPHALVAQDTVFVFLLSTHIVAIAFILVFSYFHQDKVCPKHKTL